MAGQNTMYYHHCPKCGEWVPGTQARCSKCGQTLFGLPLQVLPDEGQESAGAQAVAEREPSERKTEPEEARCKVSTDESGRIIISKRKAEPGAERYTERRDAESAERLPEHRIEESAPKKECTGCGEIHYTYRGNCPNCEGILKVVPEDEPPRRAHAVPREPDFDEDEEEEYTGHVDTETFVSEEDEEEEEPLYFFNARRYEVEGTAIYAKNANLPIVDGMDMGRSLFLRDSKVFFLHGTAEMDKRYSTISSTNVKFHVRDGKLYVGYCPPENGREKATVYLNGKPLDRERETRLKISDWLSFGGRKKTYRVIDVQIAGAYGGSSEAEWQDAVFDLKQQMQDLSEESRQGFERMDAGFGRADAGFGRMDEGFGRADQGFGRMDAGFDRTGAELEKVKEEMQGFREALAKITPSDLEIHKGDAPDKFLSLVPDVSLSEKTKRIKMFLDFLPEMEEDKESMKMRGKLKAQEKNQEENQEENQEIRWMECLKYKLKNGELIAESKKDAKRTSDMYQFFYEHKRRRERIYQTAFFEYACREMKEDNYGSAMLYLGITMEGFVMGEILPMIKSVGWKPGINQKTGKELDPNTNGVLKGLRYNWKLMKGAKWNENQKWDCDFKAMIEEAVDVLHIVRHHRNIAVHLGADTDEGEEKKITAEIYYSVKRELFEEYQKIKKIHEMYNRYMKYREKSIYRPH